MRRGKPIFISLVALMTAAVLGMGISPLSAQETAEKDKEFTDQKTLRGEVSGISNNFLAIEVSADATAVREMTFAVSKDVKVKGRDRILDIKTGDTVSVMYEETTQAVKKKDKKGKEIKEVRVLGRVVKEITLLRAAPQPEVEPETEPVTEDAPPQEAETGE